MFLRASRDCTNKMYFFIKAFTLLHCCLTEVQIPWTPQVCENSHSLHEIIQKDVFVAKLLLVSIFPFQEVKHYRSRSLWHSGPLTPLYDVIIASDPCTLKNKSGHESRSHGLCSARNSDVMGWFATGLDANVLSSYPRCQLYENSTVAFEQRTSSPLLFKHYIFISEDLRQAETLIFLITKVNSVRCSCASHPIRCGSAATVCLCLQTGTFGLSTHAILALLLQEKKYYMNFGRNVVCRQNIFFLHSQLYSDHTGEKKSFIQLY